ncbi:MAG: protoglobin domain-containing protein [Dehalococcoidia bacterium]
MAGDLTQTTGDAVERYRRAAQFLDFRDVDVHLVSTSSRFVISQLDTLVDNFYERMSAFAETERLFVKAHAISGESMDHRTWTLKTWVGHVLALLERAPALLPDTLAVTGAAHAGEGKSGVVIPHELMVLTVSLLEGIVAEALQGAAPGSLASWHKFWWVCADVMSFGYQRALTAGQANRPLLAT